MGILEWLGAHLLGPAFGLIRAILAKPRPELKIHELGATGGGGSSVDFRAVIQNVGTKSARAVVAAHVGPAAVQSDPQIVELLPSAPSTTVQIGVPRPALGDLVKAFASETTLYGEALIVEIAEGKHRATATWREHIYHEQENAERHQIQRRVWRIGRGEATEQDWVAERKAELLRKHRERFEHFFEPSDFEL